MRRPPITEQTQMVYESLDTGALLTLLVILEKRVKDGIGAVQKVAGAEDSVLEPRKAFAHDHLQRQHYVEHLLEDRGVLPPPLDDDPSEWTNRETLGR